MNMPQLPVRRYDPWDPVKDAGVKPVRLSELNFDLVEIPKWIESDGKYLKNPRWDTATYEQEYQR